MNIRTQQIRKLKKDVESIWSNPKSHSLENHYKFMRIILQREYPKTFSEIAPDTIENMLKEMVYLDRFLRLRRSGLQKELKQKLSKEFITNLI